MPRGSRVRIEQGKPSRERAPGYETLDIAAAFQGSPIGPSVDVPAAVRRGSRDWVAVDNGVTSNDGGDAITVLDLSTVNANVEGLVYVFPGGASDDNSWTFDWAVPTEMNLTPNMRLRLYFLMR